MVEDAALRQRIVVQLRRLFLHDSKGIDDSELHLHLKQLTKVNFGLVGKDNTCRLCCWSFERTDVESVIKLMDKANELEVGPLYLDRSSENFRVWRFVPSNSNRSKIRESADNLARMADVRPVELWPLGVGNGGQMQLPFMKSETDNSNCFMTVVDLGHSRSPVCINEKKVSDLFESITPTKFELSFGIEEEEITFEVMEPEPKNKESIYTETPASSYEYDKSIEYFMSEKGNTIRKYDDLVCNVCKTFGGSKCPCPLHQTTHSHGLVHFKHNNEQMDNPPKWLCIECFRKHYNRGQETNKW